MVKTHKAVVTVGPRRPLELHEYETPTPKDNEILVRAEWTASTPLDLHEADGGLLVDPPQILGDSSAGTIVAVGPDVKHFAVGDQVFGFTWRTAQEKAHQEFILAPEYLYGKIPVGFKLEDAVTLGDPFVTAFQCSVNDLGLELPWPKPEGYVPKDSDKPILIWGGSSSVGYFAIQILFWYGYKNIIATGSKKNHEFLKSLGAAAVADYRDTDVVAQIKKLTGGHVSLIMDCVGSFHGSVKPIAEIADMGTIVAIMLPVVIKDATETEAPVYEMNVTVGTKWKQGVIAKGVRTHFYLQNDFLAKHLQMDIMPAMLASGAVKPSRTMLVEGSTLLERAEKALDLLRRKVPSAERLVWKIAD